MVTKFYITMKTNGLSVKNKQTKKHVSQEISISASFGGVKLVRIRDFLFCFFYLKLHPFFRWWSFLKNQKNVLLL